MVARIMEVQMDGSGALRPPSYIDKIVLAADVEKVYTVPANAKYLVFSANGDFFAIYRGGDATSPYSTTAAIGATIASATEITDGTGPELNPTTRYVGGSTSLGNREITQVRMRALLATDVTIGVFR